METITFLRPLLLFALAAVIPITGAALFFAYHARRNARKAYGEERLVNRFSATPSRRAELSVAGAWVVAMAMLVIAAAGPIMPDAPDTVPAGSLRVVVVADVSKSMAAEDYRSIMPVKDGVPAAEVAGPYGTRLDMVKRVIKEQIMPAVTGNQLGLVTYSGNGFDQADLTDDFVSLRWVLDNWMNIGNAPGGGSDYGDGLSMALQIFDTAKEANVQKVIVLFTDGGFTGDQAALSKVLEEVKRRGIRVVIVGIGSDTPIPIPVYNSVTGQMTGYIQDDKKVTVTTGIDEGNLEKLQAATDGTYVRLNPSQNLKVEWATKLTGSKMLTHEKHIFQYPLGLALVLLFGLFLRGAVVSMLGSRRLSARQNRTSAH
jgi:Ca-activated chloride channel homolog